MDAVVIGRGSQHLTLLSSEDRPGFLVATLIDAGLKAERAIEAGYVGFSGLGTFFRELEGAWQGWDGEKAYESLDRDLQLRARHRGHVMLGVCLQEAGVGGWGARSTISVEPGEELSLIAAEVVRLVRP